MLGRINRQMRFSAACWSILIAGVAWTGLDSCRQKIQSGDSENVRFSNSLNADLPPEGGFAMAAGAWQFPHLNWSISQRLTAETPAAWCDQVQQSMDANSLSLWHDNTATAETAFDEQLRGLVQSFMQRMELQGDRAGYTLDTADLRGCAVSTGAGLDERLVAVCVQWPAEEGLWTQLELQRLPFRPLLEPLTELSAGATVTAQRLGTDGQVQVQVVEFTETPDQLRKYLTQHGWTLRQNADEKAIFLASSGAQLLEFTCQTSESGSHTALIRDLGQ